MPLHRLRFLFLNIGHAYDHLFMLLFPTVVLVLEREWGIPFAELLPYSIGGFIAFGVGSLPAGWLGDRWSRRHMITVFFLGIGASSILTGLASGPWTLAAGLTLVGLFGAVYHPVGVAMVVEEERFVRVKDAPGYFPTHSVHFCLREAGIEFCCTDTECCCALVGVEHLPEVWHRAIVQERRGCPDTVQGPCFVM